VALRASPSRAHAAWADSTDPRLPVRACERVNPAPEAPKARYHLLRILRASKPIPGTGPHDLEDEWRFRTVGTERPRSAPPRIWPDNGRGEVHSWMPSRSWRSPSILLGEKVAYIRGEFSAPRKTPHQVTGGRSIQSAIPPQRPGAVPEGWNRWKK
jgi:hypothetical protein